MKLRRRFVACIAAAGLAFPLLTSAAGCDFSSRDDAFMIMAAPDSIHYHPSPEHAKYSWLVGVELQCASHWLAGFSYFNNSFGQKSQYLYGGGWWSLSNRNEGWYAKLSAGVIHGYKEPYDDKIPFNSKSGWGPGIIPAFGYKFDRVTIQANLLGLNGVMITFGYDVLRGK